MSQIKLYRTATITMALKNIAMSFPAADVYGHPRSKQEHHHDFYRDMHSCIAAMAKRFPINRAITVGHPAMIATGPTGGIPVETGLVIASTDAVAADWVGAKLLGFGAQAVRHLREAGRLGLGETDTSKLRYPAMSLEEAARAFTEAAYRRGSPWKVRSRATRARVKPPGSPRWPPRAGRQERASGSPWP